MKTNYNFDLFTLWYKPKNGDIIVDLGSGDGSEIKIFSDVVGESGHIYALEADISLYEKNLKIVEDFNLKNVTCVNIAISDTVGDVNLGVVPGDGVSNSIHLKNSKIIKKVKSETLDSFLNNYEIDNVDFIKINIEGAEKEALLGAKDSIKKIKNWCISTHDFCGIPTKDFVIEFLNNNNIQFNFHENVPQRPWEGGYIYAKQKE